MALGVEVFVTRPTFVPPKLPVGTVYEGDLPPLPPDSQLPSSSPSSTAAPATIETAEAAKKKREERKLAIMMMSKKRKRLFDQIMKSRNKKRREVRELKRKRTLYDEEEGQMKELKRVRMN